MRTSGGTSVMARRHEALDSLDYFPTPPWATRALFEIIGEDGRDLVCWEPACGQGHMADVLREYFGAVIAWRGAGFLEAVLPWAVAVYTIFLAAMVYQAQKGIWDLDMREKRSR